MKTIFSVIVVQATLMTGGCASINKDLVDIAKNFVVNECIKAFDSDLAADCLCRTVVNQAVEVTVGSLPVLVKKVKGLLNEPQPVTNPPPLDGDQEKQSETPTIAAQRLPFADRVSLAFVRRVVEMAVRLQTQPGWLLTAFAFETAGTLRADQRSPHSSATGLIGFMAKTAIQLGTTVAELAKMSAVEQLEYVERYLAPYRGRLSSLKNLYLSILYPAAIGRAANAVVFKKGSSAYQANQALDADHNGMISVAEATAKVERLYQKHR